ncbi:hypothetical protein ACFL2V_21435 [Pseudomonadota bacterium]
MVEQTHFGVISPALSSTVALIDAHADDIAAKITADYLEQHPEFCGSSETRVRRMCKEDTLHHLSFLQNALRTGLPEIFSNYMLWLREVLLSRHLDTSHTEVALKSLASYLQETVPDSDKDKVATILVDALAIFDSSDSRSLASAHP